MGPSMIPQSHAPLSSHRSRNRRARAKVAVRQRSQHGGRWLLSAAFGRQRVLSSRISPIGLSHHCATMQPPYLSLDSIERLREAQARSAGPADSGEADDPVYFVRARRPTMRLSEYPRQTRANRKKQPRRFSVVVNQYNALD